MSLPRFINQWRQLLGVRPYAKTWNWNRGISCEIHVFHRDAWFRFLLNAFGLHVLVLTFGYDDAKSYTATKHPPALFASFLVLGFGLSWRQRDYLPT